MERQATVRSFDARYDGSTGDYEVREAGSESSTGLQRPYR